MAELHFQERVTYGKPTPVDLYAASSRCLNSVLSAQFPYFVPKPQLQAMAKSAGGVAGLTIADFSLEFPDFAAQWKCVSSGGVVTWTFQGGPLLLKSLLKIYVDDRARGRKEIVDVIMEHEFEHVADEIQVLRVDVPAKLCKDSIVQQYLIQKKPVDNAMFHNWFKTSGFQDYVEPVWAEEHNRRGRTRDSGMKYANYINIISTHM